MHSGLSDKRLEEGSYAIPFSEDGPVTGRQITTEELGALLSGIDFTQAPRRQRYFRKASEPQ